MQIRFPMQNFMGNTNIMLIFPNSIEILMIIGDANIIYEYLDCPGRGRRFFL